ncbi:GNAT family N-acetyltransferase [Nostocoides veronense]|uniref:GNAT family N-acetyltransferase n=1 Tax=Nostocoides veronense TaxID=330836 RepID=UPI0031DD2DAF
MSSPVRATVRYRLEPPPPPGQPPLTDAVGTVVRNDPEAVVLETRRGTVTIPRDRIVATRIIPPAGPRRGIAGGDLEPLALHDLVADGWPAIDTARLGGWLLRAGRGFTARANSVLPVGDPGVPLAEAVDAVEEWYAERHLPANVTLAGPEGFDPARDPLGRLLLDRGYVASQPSLFLTTRPATILRRSAERGRPAPGRHTVEIGIGGELTDEWLTAYDGYRLGDRDAARAIMTGSPAQRFATARAGGEVVGVGRLGMSGTWGGIAAMWVDPAYRRHGIARRMLGELVTAATELGATNLHLQVWADNAPALRLYESLGFRRHHAYRNLSSTPARAL